MKVIQQIFIILSLFKYSTVANECITTNTLSYKGKFLDLSRKSILSMDGKKKGDAGKIGVIGGSVEYTGAPFFAAISALKVGADLIYIITTESAAPVIKSYSPELIVYPYLNKKNASKIGLLLAKMDAVVIGPGLGRETETLKLIYEIIETCKNLSKPLVIDADGLYAISKNVKIIKNYPQPGVILTPNHKEAQKLYEAVSCEINGTQWYNYWGNGVAVLQKGHEDQFYSFDNNLNWSLTKCGSLRRAGGQGDILAGSLATFYNWALKSFDEDDNMLAQSIAAYTAAKLTRSCNAIAYSTLGRSMTASDMITKIHLAFDKVYEE